MYWIIAIPKDGKVLGFPVSTSIVTTRKVAYKYGWGVGSTQRAIEIHKDQKIVGEVYPARNGRYLVWKDYKNGTTAELRPDGNVRDTIGKVAAPFGL